MEITRTFELKVGTFILVGIAIGFLIIFSIGDINLSKAGYTITVKFDFASGLSAASPVRLAGVKVGRVDCVKVVYSDEDKKTHAEVRTWIESDAKVEEDASVTINTLGLLGEKYLEIIPGTPGAPILKDGATIIGKDPVIMEKLTENLVSLSDSVSVIMKRLEKGEGTIGKLLTEDAVYDDLKSITGNFKDFSAELKSTGTNFKDFSEDLKRHPWKLLSRPRED
ncbi:MAG: MCE family protein [Candidatus Omnitrophica bacterium]|nr:MCE family protein [Candidatus Omnitrophota bacterium]